MKLILYAIFLMLIMNNHVDSMLKAIGVLVAMAMAVIGLLKKDTP